MEENKQPKVVYHGTPNGAFTEFDYDKVGTVGGSEHGYGFYFADNEREAKLYTQAQEQLQKKKTLYAVTAFIGKSGYKNKMEAPQLANAKNLGATSEIESVVTSNISIPQSAQDVNKKIMHKSRVQKLCTNPALPSPPPPPHGAVHRNGHQASGFNPTREG